MSPSCATWLSGHCAVTVMKRRTRPFVAIATRDHSRFCSSSPRLIVYSQKYESSFAAVDTSLATCGACHECTVDEETERCTLLGTGQQGSHAGRLGAHHAGTATVACTHTVLSTVIACVTSKTQHCVWQSCSVAGWIGQGGRQRQVEVAGRTSTGVFDTWAVKERSIDATRLVPKSAAVPKDARLVKSAPGVFTTIVTFATVSPSGIQASVRTDETPALHAASSVPS